LGNTSGPTGIPRSGMCWPGCRWRGLRVKQKHSRSWGLAPRLAGEVVGSPVGSGGGDGVGGGVEVDGPAAFVDEGVMVAAEKDQVGQGGGAAGGPGVDVVAVGPFGWAVAAGEAAAAVAQHQGPA